MKGTGGNAALEAYLFDALANACNVPADVISMDTSTFSISLDSISLMAIAGGLEMEFGHAFPPATLSRMLGAETVRELFKIVLENSSTLTDP